MQGRPQPELRYHVRNGLFLAIRSPRTRLARRTCTSKHTVQVCLLTWLKRGATVCKNSNTESILSDHDSSFMSTTVQAYLSSLKIPLNVNALSDHHALGIIDNFALRIKTILTAMFLKNKSTNWINSIQNIVRHYNNRPHSSLNDISPNEATKDTNKEMVFNINIDKKRKSWR